MYMSGRGSLRKWSGGPQLCLGVVGRPSGMSGSGREVLPEDWEKSGGILGCQGLVGRPSRMSRSGR